MLPWWLIIIPMWACLGYTLNSPYRKRQAQRAGLNDPTTTLTGISINDFVVKPHTLVAAALTDTGTLLNASGAAPQPLFKRAGEPFNMVVQAQNSNGAVTPNFGLESPQTTVAAGFASMVFPNPAAP